MNRPAWISEREACQKMGIRTTQYFRRLVKNGTYNISYRTNPQGRNYQYDARAIEKLLNQNATIVA